MKCSVVFKENGDMFLNSNSHEIKINNIKWGEENSGIMSPGGLLMGALGGCKASTFNKAAKYYKMKFSDLSILVEAEIEVLDNIGDTPFKNERYKYLKSIYTLKTESTIDEVRKVIDLASKFCTIDIGFDHSVERILEINIVK